MQTARMHSLLIREQCGSHHYSALPSVAGSGRQVSCLPTLSLGAGDEWDCHSRGQLAAHCQRSLLSLSLPPRNLHAAASPVSRDVLMCSSRSSLSSLNLCPALAGPVSTMRCRVEQGSRPLQSSVSRPQNQAVVNQRPPETPRSQSKNQMWTEVLGITLVEGQDLPQYGQGDIYVRFRLGDQKYKSKVWAVVELYFHPFSILLSPFSLF